MNKEYEKHDSWGMVGIYHQHHGGRELFGSDVINHNTICLKIKTAQCSRELGRDWIMGDKTLIEVSLSANQFADLLTNANMGDGVPCTIEYMVGKGMIEYKPQKPKVEIIKEERDELAEKTVSDLESSIAMVKQLIDNKRLSKTAGEELLSKIRGAYSSLVGGNKEFFKKQAKQEIGDMVTEAKRQVQSYIDNKIYSTGLKMLQDGFVSPQLIESKTEYDLLTDGGIEMKDITFTVFIYEDDGITAADFSMYDSKEEAIEFAKNRNWDEVVNDNTGEVVWKR